MQEGSFSKKGVAMVRPKQKIWRLWLLRILALALVAGLTGAGLTLAQEETGLININTADQATLTTLRGIGEAKAKAIIEYREKNGPFKSVEEIKNVSGIGDKTFEDIKDKITVGETK